MEVGLLCLTDTVQLQSNYSTIASMLFNMNNFVSELILLQTAENCNKKHNRRRSNYFVTIEIPRFTDIEFKSHFRMSHSTVEV